MTPSKPICIFSSWRHEMRIPLTTVNEIQAYCKTHGVKSLFLFGSRARGDERQSSDFDLLVEFSDGSQISYLDFLKMKSELEAILGHKVDLVESASLMNPIRRNRILAERVPLYGA
jgi:uncharacterized protein